MAKNCEMCGTKLRTGILGLLFCPSKHGNGSGKGGLKNQPASN